MSEHYRIIEGVKIGNLSTTLPTLRPLTPTRYSSNVVATVVDLYIQHRNIRYIQRDCGLRFDRFALLSIINLNIISPRQIPHHYNMLGSPRKLSKNRSFPTCTVSLMMS